MDNTTISPTPLIPNHNLALAYVILIQPLALVKMSCIRKGLIMLQYCALALFAQQSLTQNQAIVPVLKSERLDLMESPDSGPGNHAYIVNIPDSFRARHFEFVVDRSVCGGKLVVNGLPLPGVDADEVLQFERSNRVSIGECLEHLPKAVQLWAYPKVFIAEAKARAGKSAGTVEVTVRVRNTLLNSAAASLTVLGQTEDFFIGPETSQTRSFVVRLLNRRGNLLTLELHKYGEAIEGEYKHIQDVEFLRNTQ
jgi:hypothetical protein